MFGIGALSHATGCPIDTIRYYEKLGLLERSCADALALVNNNLCEVSEKIVELQRIQKALEQMAKDCQCCCPGARAPECTIVDALSVLAQT